MTEAEWLAATDPAPMPEFLRGKASDRKLRLFAAGCCRSVWLGLPVQIKDAVGTVEAFSDGLVRQEKLLAEVVRQAGAAVYRNADLLRGLAYLPGSLWHGDQYASSLAVAAGCATRRPNHEERDKQAKPVRDILGNPFRPAVANPRWLTPTVTELAESIYSERAFDRMPVFADALEEAGSDSADVLGHCRGDGPHVRGCWVLDTLLGKK